MTGKRLPAVAGLFTEDGGAKILGSFCVNCNTPYFPKTAHCHNPGCTESTMEERSFGGQGSVWSYSVADFAPPPPHKYDKPFKPYVIAVADLECGLRLVGQMVDPLEKMKVGARVELVIDTLHHEDDIERTTWKFKLI